MASNTHEDVAARWVEGLTGDWAILEELSSTTMRVWHSHDGHWLTRQEAEAGLAESGSAAVAPSFQYVRTLLTETGFVVQASLEGSVGSGRTHIVQICTVEHGRVASCEEYIAPEMDLG